MNSPEGLIAIAHRYYPKGRLESLAIRNSPEWSAFATLWEEKMKEHHEWFELRQALKADLPGYRVGDWTVPVGPACFRCIISRDQPPSNGVDLIVVGCVSVLAPYYFAYRTERSYTNGEPSQPSHGFDLSGDAAIPAKAFARHVERAYQFQPFPKAWEEIIVPGISLDKLDLGQVTLRDAMFTHGWYDY